MLKTTVLLLFLSIFKIGFAQKEVTVFESGKEGFSIFRIPSIINLPNQKIIAFAEGRVNGGADFGNIKLVMKSSDDQGLTWSPLKQVVSFDNWQVGNAAPVVDLLDPEYPKGKIYLFYNTGNASEQEVRNGKGLREVWYITSTDQGKSWSTPTNITSQVHYANGRMEDRNYQSEKDWRTYANTPGHATQCLEGKYKGRIYIAANHSQGSPKQKYVDYSSHGYYTDDHGKSFKISESLPIQGSNESTAAFVSNDRLILNARNQRGDIKNRIVAISKDGGAHFDTSFYDQKLIDPVCEAALLNIGKKNNKTILAFVNNADTMYRNHLTLSISMDEGVSWPIQKEIARTNDLQIAIKDFTAYADLIKLGSRKVGVLFEKNNYSKINFKLIKW